MKEKQYRVTEYTGKPGYSHKKRVVIVNAVNSQQARARFLRGNPDAKPERVTVGNRMSAAERIRNLIH